MRLPVIRHSRLASAGDIGGMMGKKLGLGKFLALPVIRQNDILFQLISHLVSNDEFNHYTIDQILVQ